MLAVADLYPETLTFLFCWSLSHLHDVGAYSPIVCLHYRAANSAQDRCLNYLSL